jgi:23S rRNA pseudouridine1911/1915/1917 synthase
MTNKNPTIIINASESGTFGIRLDLFLHTVLPEHSRNYLQDLIKNGHVQVNNAPMQKSNYYVKEKDVLSISLKNKEWNLAPTEVPFQVIDEQEDFLIINKPAGLLVHHATSSPEEVTLVNGLLHAYPDMQNQDSTERPGIVHRIDKHTSGLLLVARNLQAQNTLAEMFKARKIEKTYLAVVDGITPAEGRIELPVGRHPTERHKMSTVGIESRSALSFYTAKEYFPSATLLEVRIVTGRTHQIRVHCAAIGHGLLGDATYGVASPLIPRQALHAWQMKFEYKEKTFSYQAPLPEDITSLLVALRQK